MLTLGLTLLIGTLKRMHDRGEGIECLDYGPNAWFGIIFQNKESSVRGNASKEGVFGGVG